MIDDSIVRGTTSDRIVKMLRDAGATEVSRKDQFPTIPVAMLLLELDIPERETADRI